MIVSSLEDERARPGESWRMGRSGRREVPAEDAERQVRAAYRAGDIVLDAEDCADVEITAV